MKKPKKKEIITQRQIDKLKRKYYWDIAVDDNGVRIRECAKEIDEAFSKWIGKINRDKFFEIMHFFFIIRDKEYFDEMNYYQDCINKIEHTLRFRALQRAAQKTEINIDRWSEYLDKGRVI